MGNLRSRTFLLSAIICLKIPWRINPRMFSGEGGNVDANPSRFFRLYFVKGFSWSSAYPSSRSCIYLFRHVFHFSKNWPRNVCGVKWQATCSYVTDFLRGSTPHPTSPARRTTVCVCVWLGGVEASLHVCPTVD